MHFRLGVDENGRIVKLEELKSDDRAFDDSEDICDGYRQLMMLGEVDHRSYMAAKWDGKAAWNKKYGNLDRLGVHTGT